MPAYDISTHPLLSDRAKRLVNENITVFNAQVDAAAVMLGLESTTYTGSKAERAKLALVYQVNFQLERTEDSDIYDSVKEGERTLSFRKDRAAVDTVAIEIAEDLLAEDEIAVSRPSPTMSVSNQQSW